MPSLPRSLNAERRVLILYGSQTGNAVDAAERIAAAIACRGCLVSLQSLDEFPVAELPLAERVIFVVSTAGDGEFPDAALRFWRFMLRSDLPSHALASLRATVFGLGDSSYAKYNAAARKLSARLSQLGAALLCARGLGDWQSPRGIVGDLEAWLVAPDGLLAALDAELSPDARSAAAAAATAVPPLPRVRFAVRECARASAWLLRAETAFPVPWPTVAPRDALPYAPEENSLPVNDMGAGIMGQRGIAGGECVDEDVIESESLANSADDYDHVERGDYFSARRALLRAAGLAPLLCSIESNRRVTAPSWPQSVHHVTFSPLAVETSTRVRMQPRWVAGDVATVFVENPPFAVSAFAERIGIPLDLVVCIRPLARGDACDAEPIVSPTELHSALAAPSWAFASSLPEPARAPLVLPPLVSVRTLLSRYLSICAPPRRSSLQVLAEFATEQEQAAKLREIAGADGAALFNDYITREARSWLDLLCDFHSVRVPLAVLLELIPRLEPRSFSVASAPPASIELAVGRIEYKTPRGQSRVGVGSSFLCAAPRGALVALWLRSSKLRVRARADGTMPPLLLIGPGLGVAPMRALVHAAEVAAAVQLAGAAAPPPPSPVHLFYGCRDAAADDLYGDELRARAAASGAARETHDSAAWRGLDVFVTAYSRAGSAPRVDGAKDYVTSRLRDAADDVRALIAGGGHVRIAGSAKRMPADVLAVLRAILGGHSADAEAEGARILAALEREGRLAIEAWS